MEMGYSMIMDDSPPECHSADRISLLLPDLAMGGAERVFLTLAGGFVQHGHEVHLVVARAAGPLLEELPPAVRLVDLGVGSEIAAFFPLVRYLRREKPHALLSTLDVMSSVAVLARDAAGLRTRLLLREANTPSEMPRAGWKKPLERMAVRRLFPRADVLVAVSRGVARDLSTYAGIPLDRITPIYNPVLPDDLPARIVKPVAHPWFAAGQPPVILGVGSLVWRKNFSLLLEAFSRIAGRSDARLLILGEGEQRAALEAMIVRLGLSDRVSLPGQAPDVYPYMARSSVFVLSSNLEGLPNVLIQALASGCPVVSTDCPSGPREILDGGHYGRLVPVGDADAMAQAILAALNGIRQVVPAAWLEQFRVATVVKQYLAALDLTG